MPWPHCSSAPGRVNALQLQFIGRTPDKHSAPLAPSVSVSMVTAAPSSGHQPGRFEQCKAGDEKDSNRSRLRSNAPAVSRPPRHQSDQRPPTSAVPKSATVAPSDARLISTTRLPHGDNAIEPQVAVPTVTSAASHERLSALPARTSREPETGCLEAERITSLVTGPFTPTRHRAPSRQWSQVHIHRRAVRQGRSSARNGSRREQDRTHPGSLTLGPDQFTGRAIKRW